MTHSNLDAWSEARAKSTLSQLRNDYPGYTTNELYAIWCHVNGEIPLDSGGKVILDEWKTQGVEDGEFIEGGPFKVSPMLFGRALKAERGVAKPPRKARAVEASPTVAAIRPEGKPGLSPRALEFAQSYDHAAKLINAIVLHRHDIEDLSEELREVKVTILEELAAASPEAGELLKEVGALGAAAS